MSQPAAENEDAVARGWDQPVLPLWKRLPISLALAVCGACIWGFYVRGDHLLPWLGWFSTLPWLVLALHPRLRSWDTLLLSFLSAHAGTMLSVEFLNSRGFVAWASPIPFYTPFLLPLFLLAPWIQSRWPRLPIALTWPLVYVGLEWAQARFSPGELALWDLAQPQAVLPVVIQLVDVTGVSGVSFVIASFTGFLGAVLLRRYTHPDGARRSLVGQALFVAALTTLTLVYGLIRNDPDGLVDGPRVLLIQTMTSRANPEEHPEIARTNHEVQVMQTLSSKRDDIDLVIWPENSLQVPLYREDESGAPVWDAYRRPDLEALAVEMDAPVLVSGVGVLRDGVQTHGLAALYAPGREPQVHRKVQLMAWSEYLPFRELANAVGLGELWAGFVAQGVGYDAHGVHAPIEDIQAMGLEQASGDIVRFGTPVCFEAASPRVVRRWQRDGADFLVNQTSEGSLGESIHERTLSICRLRAVENRMPVVRCGNDGISAVIDPNGQVRGRLRGRYSGVTTNEPGVLEATLLLDPERKGTIYGKFGDWLPLSCLILSAFLALFARVPTLLALVGRRRERDSIGVEESLPSASVEPSMSEKP